MKVVVYLPSYSVKLKAIMLALAEGIPGCDVRYLEDYIESDVAAIFGTVKKSYPPTHAKQRVLDNHSGRRLIIVESAFVKRKQFYQVAWGGFAGHGDFNNDNVPLDRWESFDIPVKPWSRKRSGYVLVCGQRPHDTTVQHSDHIAWCHEAVRYYQAKAYKVKFRPHPREKDASIYKMDESILDFEKLGPSLKRAERVVTFNSTTGVDAVIAGKPTVVCDEGSMAKSVASFGFDAPLVTPDRTRFLARLGYSQWTPEEMRSGETWRHLNSG